MTIAVLGAGSIGCFVGGSLLAAGSDVIFIGRAKMKAQIAAHGMVLTDLAGREQRLAASQIHYTEQAEALSQAQLILVTVKSAATRDAAQSIARHARPDALIISLQNGIGNAEVLRQVLPHHTVLGGMVPFNVVQMDAGRWHRGTFGELTIEAADQLAPWQAAFAAAHLPLHQDHHFHALQWGKLLLNLNNPVNALANIPLKAELSQRAYRQCLALLIDEALGILRLANITPTKVAAVPGAWLPSVLRLPDPVFKLVARNMLKIDPEARSSMWEDLQAGRKTEIDYINGAVLQLARQHGQTAPANARIIDLIHQAEQGGQRSFGAHALWQAIRSPQAVAGG